MSRLRVSRAVVLLSLLPLAGLPLLAQPIAHESGEFQVNSYTTDFQMNAVVAFDPDGEFTVVWASYGQDGSNNGIFARRFNAAGAALASEFQVNSYSTGDQRYPDLDCRP